MNFMIKQDKKEQYFVKHNKINFLSFYPPFCADDEGEKEISRNDQTYAQFRCGRRIICLVIPRITLHASDSISSENIIYFGNFRWNKNAIWNYASLFILLRWINLFNIHISSIINSILPSIKRKYELSKSNMNGSHIIHY